MEPTVYIETTIPSSYYDNRPEPEMVARQRWTRRWRDEHRSDFRLFTSAAVSDELMKADHPDQAQKVALIGDLPLLEITRDVIQIADTYIRRYVTPADPGGDALHLALAVLYKMDILLTWNCAHLANERKLPHIRRTNAMMGLFTPDIITPLSLLGE